MREILFRGKRTDNGKWEYGYFDQSDVFAYVSKWKDVYEREDTKVIQDTVGQYTGFTDKNGNKIFEGDIFKFCDEAWESSYTSCGTEYDSWEVENYGEVGFDKDSGKYGFCRYKYNENSVEADLNENHTIEFSDFIQELEIIGNIHDNPELLEE